MTKMFLAAAVREQATTKSSSKWSETAASPILGRGLGKVVMEPSLPTAWTMERKALGWQPRAARDQISSPVSTGHRKIEWANSLPCGERHRDDGRCRTVGLATTLGCISDSLPEREVSGNAHHITVLAD